MLLEIHTSKKGKVSDKWKSYLTVYEQIFADLKDQPINLVEIGVQNGGSLETWNEYFVNAQSITGVDIDEKCKNLTFNDEKIKVFVQDGKKSIPGNYDIIIDDGSHTSQDIVEQFKSWFPYLKTNGIYIIEDLHTMWMGSKWGSGAEKFFANMINDINREFHNMTSYEIKSMSFYNSMIVIYKGQSLLGERLICGNEKII